MINRRKGRVAVSTPKPTTVSLLSHILRAIFTGGMLFLIGAGGVLILFLDYNRVSLDIPLIAIFGPLILLAFLSGSSAWQQDWHEYHRKLAEKRQQDRGRHFSHHL